MGRSLVVCLLWLSVFFPVFSFGFDWDEDKRVPVRPEGAILGCVALLCPQEIPANSTDFQINHAVGVVVSKNTIEDFEIQIDRLVEERGRGAVQGAYLYVGGIAMGKAKVTRTLFQRALKTRGFYDVTVVIMSAPGTEFNGLSLQSVRAIQERIVNWLPSYEMDAQKPLKGEVVAGLASNGFIEAWNYVYLSKMIHGWDLGLSFTVHSGIIAAYQVFAQSMLNWLTRPALGAPGDFLKSATTSFPFILNFAVFGNYSKIHNYYLMHGWDATLAQFPHELANFSTTQGLTTFLQFVFYRVVITDGFGAWQKRQKGLRDTNLVRTISLLDRTPILVMDAIALFMASTNVYPLYEYGAFTINGGHLALAGLIVAGKTAFWWEPNFLDPTLRWSKAIIDVIRDCFRSVKASPPDPSRE